jgi:GntR family transcriptional regulator / MocR family aminotransferase
MSVALVKHSAAGGPRKGPLFDKSIGPHMGAHGIVVDRRSAVPLHQQLASSIRLAILRGDLMPRERIVSSRELQTHLGLSRNTIVNALDQLIAEGHLVTVRGRGTFVAHYARKSFTKPKQLSTLDVKPTREATVCMSAQQWANNVYETKPFHLGLPALDLFPTQQFRRCFRTSDWTKDVLNYPVAQGYEPLRDAVAQRLRQTRGVACSADQVFITNGAQAAFALIIRALLETGDLAVVEDPGYRSVYAILTARGIHIHAAPVDDAGIDVDAFARCRAGLVYVTPSHQYPTGVILSLDRRFALLEWAERRGSWIVEDDYDSEFNYTGRPQPALHVLADGGRVLYVGTFSKVLSPALRLAYIVVPTVLRKTFAAVQTVVGSAPDTVTQAALARFMDAGYLSRHISKMRRVYDERRRFISAELGKRDVFHVRDSRAGLHFIVELSKGLEDREVSRRATSAGLIVPALSSFYYSRVGRRGLLIGFAAHAKDQAREAIDVLASLCDS